MFDPYRKWLGIQPKEQPPNHYRLLSVDLFENDFDVIEGAADRTMGFVRQYQSGEHAADAARILNELATARLCLLKPDKKVAYDEKLRKEIAAATPPVAAPLARKPAPEVSVESSFADIPLSEPDLKPLGNIAARKKKAPKSKSKPVNGQLIGFAVVVGLLLFVYLAASPQIPFVVNKLATTNAVHQPMPTTASALGNSNTSATTAVRNNSNVAAVETTQPVNGAVRSNELNADGVEAVSTTSIISKTAAAARPMTNEAQPTPTSSTPKPGPTAQTPVSLVPVQPAQPVRFWPGFLGRNQFGVFTKDSSHFLYVTGNDVLIVDTETGEDVVKLSGHKRPVQIARFTDDEGRVVSVGTDETIRIWDASTRKQIASIKAKTSEQGTLLIASEDGGRIAYSSAGERRLTIMNLTTKAEIRHIDLTEREVQWRAVSRDFKWAMSNGIRNQTTIWNLQNQTSYEIDNGHHNYCGYFDEDASQAMLAGHNRWDLWDFQTKTRLAEGTINNGHIYAVGMSPGEGRFLTGHSDGVIYLWDPATGRKLTQFGSDNRPIAVIVVSPDKKFALSQDQSAMIRLWRLPE